MTPERVRKLYWNTADRMEEVLDKIAAESEREVKELVEALNVIAQSDCIVSMMGYGTTCATDPSKPHLCHPCRARAALSKHSPAGEGAKP